MTYLLEMNTPDGWWHVLSSPNLAYVQRHATAMRKQGDTIRMRASVLPISKLELKTV